MQTPRSLDDLFAEAVGHPAGAERDACIERVCGGDALLEQATRWRAKLDASDG